MLIEELAHTLSYAKFADRIKGFGTSVDELVARYAALVSLVTPSTVPRVVPDRSGAVGERPRATRAG